MTKSMIKLQGKYLVCIDTKSCLRSSDVLEFANENMMCLTVGSSYLLYKILKADNIVAAMCEANELFDSSLVYLMTIAERQDEVLDEYEVVYKEILTSRQATNWHPNLLKYSENPYFIGYDPDILSFRTICPVDKETF